MNGIFIDELKDVPKEVYEKLLHRPSVIESSLKEKVHKIIEGRDYQIMYWGQVASLALTHRLYGKTREQTFEISGGLVVKDTAGYVILNKIMDFVYNISMSDCDTDVKSDTQFRAVKRYAVELIKQHYTDMVNRAHTTAWHADKREEK